MNNTGIERAAPDSVAAAPIRTYTLEVPEHLKFHRLPHDIHRFIIEIAPNARYQITRHLRRREIYHNACAVDDIFNAAVTELLGTSDKHGVERWRRYDPSYRDRNGNLIPYYGWFLHQVSYSILTHVREEFSYYARHSTDLFNEDEDGDSRLERQSCETGLYAEALSMTVHPDDLEYSDNLHGLEAELARLMDFAPQTHDPFYAHAAALFRLAIDTLTTNSAWPTRQEVASRFGLPLNLAQHWVERLQTFLEVRAIMLA